MIARWLLASNFSLGWNYRTANISDDPTNTRRWGIVIRPLA
jgi:hypothetical protein